jgi:CRP/FNR family transcriptional regulator, cyclic AMP receptor protein
MTLRRRDEAELAETLRDLPRFNACEDDDIGELVRRSVVTHLPMGWNFVQQRSPVDAAYVLLDGGIDVEVDGEKVSSFGPGDIVDDAAFSGGRSPRARATTKSPVRMLHVESSDFYYLVTRTRLRDVLLHRPAHQT